MNVIFAILILSKSSVHIVIVPDNRWSRNWIFFPSYCCVCFVISFAVTRHLTVALCA